MGLRKVLIANRGEIALRIVRACADEAIRSVVATSQVDWDSLPARTADERVNIGPAAAAQSYLSVSAVIAAALATGCDAIHPGYGFLAECAELAQACVAHGLVFVGPSADTIRRGGDKIRAQRIARAAGVPISGDAAVLSDVDAAVEAAAQLGYPVLIKAAAGGGGRGMVLGQNAAEVRSALPRARAEAQAAFGDGRVYLERFVADARHVEVQILADQHGNVVVLGDRDCSCQRRYQKVIEEAPAPGIAPATREKLAEAAIAVARALDYVNAGTVEFLVDRGSEEFVFLEVNTRVQVEHPVTEEVTGFDIVREQLRIAAGEKLSVPAAVRVAGHAIECRINCEDPERDFIPTPGRIEQWLVPSGDDIRIDSHCFAGYPVPPHYDSLLGKIIVRGVDRETAVDRMLWALDHMCVAGVTTNIAFLKSVIGHPDFRAHRINTRWLETRLRGPRSEEEA